MLRKIRSNDYYLTTAIPIGSKEYGDVLEICLFVSM